MATPSQIYLLLFALLTLTTSTMSAFPTIYEVLQEFGFPVGLLPDSVIFYNTNQENDDPTAFEITLSKPCYVKYDYLVYFDTKITGKIVYGQITELKGIQAQLYVLWLDIDEIKVSVPSSTGIYFTFGFLLLKLDIAQFETIPTCKDKARADCNHSLDNLVLINQLPLVAE